NRFIASQWSNASFTKSWNIDYQGVYCYIQPEKFNRKHYIRITQRIEGRCLYGSKDSKSATITVRI
ncbi:MAG TPA: hypothetical protein VLH16_00205, partial [Bacteroidales bacterium]|nr:hypothetical protein [Bacteroidales bacterium]